MGQAEGSGLCWGALFSRRERVVCGGGGGTHSQDIVIGYIHVGCGQLVEFLNCLCHAVCKLSLARKSRALPSHSNSKLLADVCVCYFNKFYLIMYLLIVEPSNCGNVYDLTFSQYSVFISQQKANRTCWSSVYVFLSDQNMHWVVTPTFPPQWSVAPHLTPSSQTLTHLSIPSPMFACLTNHEVCFLGPLEIPAQFA